MPDVKSINELEQLLQKKRDHLKVLQKRRNRLTAQVAKVDKEIALLQGKAGAPKKTRRPRRRGRGPRGLEPSIVDVLKASPEPQTAAEIAEAVEKTGYRSKSKDFVSLVRQVCYRSKLVQTKGRGRFVAASAAERPRRVPKHKKAAAK